MSLSYDGKRMSRGVPSVGMTAPVVDLTDSANFVSGVPHEWFAELRRQGVVWQPERRRARLLGRHPLPRLRHGQPRLRAFSSARKAVFIWDLPAEELAQQQLMMLNMDPPLHTRYRRLVNKGFTPADGRPARRSGSTRPPTRSSTA